MAEIVVKSDLQKTHKKDENKVVPRIAVIVTKRALDNHKNVLTFAPMLKKNPRKLLKTVHEEQNNLESVHGEDITEIQNSENFSNVAKTLEITQNSGNFSNVVKTREITQNFTGNDTNEALIDPMSVVKVEMKNGEKLINSNDAGTSGGNENKQTVEKYKQTTNNVSEMAKSRGITSQKDSAATEDLKWTLSCVKCKQSIQVRNYEYHLRNVHKIFNVKVQVKSKPST